MTEPPPAGRITVIFLLYRAAREVPGLVESLVAQTSPRAANQADWLEAIFMDDASGDGTTAALEASLAAIGAPSWYRTVLNPVNLGLAATLNKALGMARTPYALTCHLDCRFGSDHYVATMLDLLERTPAAAAITGQPVIPDPHKMPFAEKLNVVTNLMDIFPSKSGELVPVGFAEGRCDAFRIHALQEVGLYDTQLRTAGEDQVLAAKLRARGYEVYQAPALRYTLSVSGEQNTVRRLARHQWLFGLAHPYILLHTRGTRTGVASGRAGGNRRARALLRLTQVGAIALYAFAIAALAAGWPAVSAALLAIVVVTKAALFVRHLRVISFSPLEHVGFWVVQPLLDAAYTVGLAQGAWRAVKGTGGDSIG